MREVEQVPAARNIAFVTPEPLAHPLPAGLYPFPPKPHDDPGAEELAAGLAGADKRCRLAYGCKIEPSIRRKIHPSAATRRWGTP
jgi:hypothetical protein